MYKTFYAKNLLLLVVFFAVAAFLFTDTVATLLKGATPLDDEKLRRILLEKGIAVSGEDPEISNIRIPEEFDNVYLQYNDLQKAAGYSIEDYKGENAVLFTYRLSDSVSGSVNVIVYKNRIIGGDISVDTYGTDMLPLMAPEPDFGE